MGAWGRYNQTLRRCVAFAISASLLVGIMGCGNGERHPSTVAGRREQVIDGFIRRTMSRLGLPSVSIAVVSEGHIEDEREIDRTPVGVQESGGGKRYEIGSVTKQFTAAAILLLQQDGKLTLDEPVSRFFPDLTEAGRVTLRELLSHTAGYPDYYATLSSRAIFRDTTLDRILSQYAKVPLDFRPGTRWAYSNTGYTILTRIIEKASGESYSGFLSSRIFRPLRMSSAIYEGRPDFGRQTVVGYERVLLGPLQRAEPEGRNWLNGAAGLAMTAHDLAIWNISLLRGDLLSAASKKAMFAIQRASGRPTGYGLGFYVTHLGNETFISHEGSVKGFTSESALIPQNNFAVVVLCNQGDTIAPLFLAEGIAGAYNLFPIAKGAGRCATDRGRRLDFQRSGCTTRCTRDAVPASRGRVKSHFSHGRRGSRRDAATAFSSRRSVACARSGEGISRSDTVPTRRSYSYQRNDAVQIQSGNWPELRQDERWKTRGPIRESSIIPRSKAPDDPGPPRETRLARG